MQTAHIEITKMKLGDYEVPVPQGLSDLLNTAGAWGIKRQDPPCVKQYDRRVEKRDGRLFTVLTLKGGEGK